MEVSFAMYLRHVQNRLVFGFLLIIFTQWGPVSADSKQPLFEKDDRILFIGNTFAERLQYSPYFEWMLCSKFQDLNLSIRHMGWSGDTLGTQLRPFRFGSRNQQLEWVQPDVIFACFGMSDSYDLSKGYDVKMFGENLTSYLQSIKTILQSSDNNIPKIVLISPIFHETLGQETSINKLHNLQLLDITEEMRRVAKNMKIRFIDLYHPSKNYMLQSSGDKATINGIHLNDAGAYLAAQWMMESLGHGSSKVALTDKMVIKEKQSYQRILKKNETFFLRWRAVNGEYIYGRRKKPYGVITFPSEMKAYDQMVTRYDQEIWQLLKNGK